MSEADKHADLLYQILPALYREKDTSGDLQTYLSGCGLLLDQFYHTLRQRYADIFADGDDAFPLQSQTWLLPYIAQLLDVRLVSPLEEGRRSEITNAIAWRKAKGTLAVIEQVAEAVGGFEVVVHEGWRRVATTARIGTPLLPAEAYGYTATEPAATLAPMRSRHPGLPAGTVDLRCPAGATPAAEDNPAARLSRLRGKTYRWRQSSLHGAPSCFDEQHGSEHQRHSILPMPNSEPDWIGGYFDDPSVRTVDLRSPDWRHGFFNPRHVLLFTPPADGFFCDSPHRFSWSDNWELGQVDDAAFLDAVDVRREGNTITFRNRSLDTGPFVPVVIRRRVKLGQVADGTGPVDAWVWRFEGLVFRSTIEADSGRLVFERCAVLAAKAHAIDTAQPVITANDCLFKRVQAARGLARLQYCTVLEHTIAEALQATDCIFAGNIRRHHDPASLPGDGCVRYSAITPGQSCGDLRFYRHQKQPAIFINQVFGEPGCGVLHPAAPSAIGQGAEDGGEMGAYHHLHLVARRAAVVKKLIDYLPTGIKAVVVQDPSFYDMPHDALVD